MAEDRKHERDPDAPATPEEIAAAESLRGALEDPSRADADADFARALALAHAPRAIAEDEHRAIVAKAVAPMKPKASGGRVIRVTFGVAAVVALAASVILAVGNVGGPERAAKAELVPARSTQPLFVEPFARTGGESARIDRIAMARAQDYRDNRFAAWGVK